MPWQPGQSGNPNGRPRHSIREAIRKAAGKKRPDGTTNVAAVADVAWRLAITGGNLDAIKFLTDQIDGKVPTPMHHSGPEGGPIEVDIERVRDRLSRRAAQLAADSGTTGAD